MHRYCILFDLDGTLTDSAEGILKSIVYSLEKKGAPIPSKEVLTLFIGPPLVESYEEHCGMTPEEAALTYSYFRERYTTVGKFENQVYEGIPALLEALRQKGALLAVATAKPEPLARQILEHFDLNTYFSVIKGADLERNLVHKDDILYEALQECNGLLGSNTEKTAYYMVGDRKYDMEAARNLQCEPIGVLFGFGSAEELRQAGAAVLCQTPQDVYRHIYGQEK